MLRLWLTSIGFGIVTAWYEGLDPLSPYLYEWIILGGIAFFGGGVLLAAAILRSGLLVLMALGAVPLAMGYAERLLAEGIKPRAAFHRYTEDPPVGLETWVEGSYLYGRITNRHPRNWLRLAMVSCRPIYANGNLSQRVLEVSIGAGGWMAPGEMLRRHSSAQMAFRGSPVWPLSAHVAGSVLQICTRRRRSRLRSPT